MMAGQHPHEQLRQHYFLLTRTLYEEVQRGTPANQLQPLKEQIDAVLQEIKALDDRRPDDLIRD